MFRLIHKNNSGFTLIEMMIAMLLSGVIIEFLFNLYITNYQRLSNQETVNIFQHKILFLNALFRNEVHKAGLIGCGKLTSSFPHTQFEMLNFKNKLMIHPNGFSVRYTESKNYLIKQLDQNTLLIDKNNHLKKGSIMLINDCLHMELFKVKYIAHNKEYTQIKTEELLRYFYLNSASVGTLIIHHYYLFNRQLMMEDVQHHKMLIAKNIDQLQLKGSIAEDNMVKDFPSDQIANHEILGIHFDISFKEKALIKHDLFYASSYN